jgi:DNA-binding LytR/AlgR family response regulator
MKIKVEIDSAMDEVEVIIRAKEWSTELQDLIQLLEGGGIQRLVGIVDQQYHILEFHDIYSISSEDRKVYAETKKGKVEIRMKLYELEIVLKKANFVRFSKSTLANLTHVRSFEMSFNGSMCAHFSNGMKEYVSRKYVPEIKETLQMGGKKNG